MKRKYEYMIRVGVIAFCLFCVLVCLATMVYTVGGKETPPTDENVCEETCEPAVVVIEAEEQVEIRQEAAEAPVRDDDLGPDLMLLAKVITCEMGCEWIGAEQKYNVGSVVLNRVADPRFPGNIYDVVWQPGQYACATSGALFMAQPSEEVIAIARDLLENGSRLPADVVWQAEFKQGNGVYAMYRDEVLGTTTYYCY